jgi:hypothetical protein
MRIAWLALSAGLLLVLAACSPAMEAGPSGPARAAPAEAAPAPEALDDALAIAIDTLPPDPDRSCRVDADCAVKNVGNCCGYFPACANVQAETFPERVMAACEAQGLSSICGFEDITACACVEGRCEAAPGGGELRQSPCCMPKST